MGKLYEFLKARNMSELVESTNLIDCEIEDGGYAERTGEKITGNYYRTADYIAVEPNTDYVYGRDGVSIAVYVCLYTSDKTFIERLYPRSGEYFTTSESTHYITMYRSNTTTSEQWQLNKGQSILPYEDYFEPYHKLSFLNLLLMKKEE